MADFSAEHFVCKPPVGGETVLVTVSGHIETEFDDRDAFPWIMLHATHRFMVEGELVDIPTVLHLTPNDAMRIGNHLCRVAAKQQSEMIDKFWDAVESEQ
jgi:hypothetical protein